MLILIQITCHFLSEHRINITRAAYCSDVDTRYDDHAMKELLKSFADGGTIDLEKDEVSGIATVTLNDPDVRNALSGMCFVLGTVIIII